MLTMFFSEGETFRREVSPAGQSLAGDAVWFDLLNPDRTTLLAVEAATGLVMPSAHDLEAIELSSRLYTEHGAAYLNMPVITRDEAGGPVSDTLGFILSRTHLVTIRSGPLPLSEGFIDKSLLADPNPNDASHVFVLLLEGIVERAADQLERIRDELDTSSRRLFNQGTARPGSSGDSAALREALRTIGQAGDFLSRIRDSMLALSRIAGFVPRAAGPLPADLKERLDIIGHDVAALSDYDNHLSSKAQFMLDATLGFINIEQNHVIKVLAVVGTVGVPPTLIASIYGMNFESMPELKLWFAYPLALFAIFLSALIPLVWFRVRGWL